MVILSCNIFCLKIKSWFGIGLILLVKAGFSKFCSGGSNVSQCSLTQASELLAWRVKA